MHEKDNYLKTAELSTEQNCNDYPANTIDYAMCEAEEVVVIQTLLL